MNLFEKPQAYINLLSLNHRSIAAYRLAHESVLLVRLHFQSIYSRLFSFKLQTTKIVERNDVNRN